MMSCRVVPDLEDDRLRVAGLRVGRERPPDLRTGHLVEGDDLGVGLSPHERDEPVIVDQWGAGDTPRWDLGAVFLDVIPLPQHLAGLDVQGVQHTGGAEHIDPVAVDGWGGARPGRPCGQQAGVARLPFVRPQDAAGLLVEADDALDHVVAS